MPVTSRTVPFHVAAVMTGKLRRPFAPVSASRFAGGSFGVTPNPFSPAPPTRLMPSPPLFQARLISMRFALVAVASTRMPSPPLFQIQLPSVAPLPPMGLATALAPRMRMPFWVLPRFRVRPASVPM